MKTYYIYITRYYNDDGLCYGDAIFTSKREALKKRGARSINVIRSRAEYVYHSDNWGGWVTDDPRWEDIV